MFVSTGRLPHVLAPECYTSAEQYARECESLLIPGWHAVCSRRDVPTPGSFLTFELLGHAIGSLSLKEVALRHGCSREHLTRVFAERIGIA